jgi:hypothetical protein
MAKKQKLRVWWIPQVPMEAFYIPVESPEEGQKVMNILLSSEKNFYLNYLCNNQLLNKIRSFKNYNSLSSIKEEEKSKAELTNSELQIDAQEKQSNINLKRDRIKLKNIILKENSYFIKK